MSRWSKLFLGWGLLFAVCLLLLVRHYDSPCPAEDMDLLLGVASAPCYHHNKDLVLLAQFLAIVCIPIAAILASVCDVLWGKKEKAC